MPSRTNKRPPHGSAIKPIVTSTSDNDFLDHLIEGMRDANLVDLWHTLDKFSSDRDRDIENMCTSNHSQFVKSVNRLDQGREDSTRIGGEILALVESYQESTDKLAGQKKNLVDSRSVRHNVDESVEALKESLGILRLANQVHELVGKKKHYAALRALDELQNSLHINENSRYKIGEMMETSIPATQKMIAEAVMNDLNTWLYRIRDVSQYIGEIAFYYTDQRRTRQKERAAKDGYLGSFKLNSPIELVADEMEEFDVLNNDEQVAVNFSPLLECLHIHDALGQVDHFKMEYATTRRRQKDLIIPSQLHLDDDEVPELKTLLEGIAGFSIVERATQTRSDNLRTTADVDELWDSMCQSAISLMSSALQAVDNADLLLRVTGVVSLFIQTMESYKFYASALNNFLMTLFERYTVLLKDRCSDDFQEKIVATDDYMPMPIKNMEEYDKIVGVGWYTPEKPRHEITFPTVLPFSQMYPMCCIDIRNFLNQTYSAPDEYLQRSTLIDDTIRNSLDELLADRICAPLIEHLQSQYPGQIVQILTNFEHFEIACQELQKELGQARTARSKAGPIMLKATERFREGRKLARDRIFQLVKSKIDDLVETAEYDWTSNTDATEPSNYITELTRYLSNIMNSVLLGLPSEIKDLIYFDALDHAASNILALPLDTTVTTITPSSAHLLTLDINHLTSFISTLPSHLTQPGANASPSNTQRATQLNAKLAELTQTAALMDSSNPDEFYDINLRDKSYGAVDPRNGAMLLEKVESGRQAAMKDGRALSRSPLPRGGLGALGASFSNASASSRENLAAGGQQGGDKMAAYRAQATERFGGMMRGLRRDKGEGSSS